MIFLEALDIFGGELLESEGIFFNIWALPRKPARERRLLIYREVVLSQHPPTAAKRRRRHAHGDALGGACAAGVGLLGWLGWLARLLGR